MGHPATNTLPQGATIVAQRQPDLWVNLFVPPYNVPGQIGPSFGFRPSFSSASIFPVIPYGYATQGTIPGVGNVGVANSIAAVSVQPLSFGEINFNTINITGGAVTNSFDGQMLYGDTYFILSGGFFIEFLCKSTLLPGIINSSNTLQGVTPLFNINGATFPPPGSGPISPNFSQIGLTPMVVNLGGQDNLAVGVDFYPQDAFQDFLLTQSNPAQVNNYAYGFDNFNFVSSSWRLSYPWTANFASGGAGQNNFFLNAYTPASPQLQFVNFNFPTRSGYVAGVQLDDPAFNTKLNSFVSAGLNPNLTFFGYLFNANGANYWTPDQPWSCILLSPDCTKWALVRFKAVNPTIISDISNPATPLNVTIDPNGVFYVKTISTSVIHVWNSFTLDLSFPFTPFTPINWSQVPPLSLPGLCGCLPVNLGLSSLKKGKI